MAALSLRSGSPLLLRLPNGVSACFLNLQPYSTEVNIRPNLAAMKRGRGGRSSFSGEVVTVFGSSGFLGRGVVNRLGKNGSQMVLPYRGDHYKMMRLKVAGDLGQVLFCPFELRDEDSIRRAVEHSSIVINLIGRGWETRNFKYEDVNIEGPATLARISKEMGVKRFVHMSHVNARENPNKVFLPGGSPWLRTKWQGEMAVKEEFPEATIFRAADAYGNGDAFLNYYLSKFRQTVERKVSLYAKGELSVKQPIWGSDLVSGIMASLSDPSAIGTTYEALGPERLTLAAMVDYMHHAANRDEYEYGFKRTELMTDPGTFIRIWMMETFGYKLGQLNMYYGTTLDKLERHALTDESLGLPNITDLGVKLHTFEDKVPYEVKPWDYSAYYLYALNELPKPVPPTPVTMREERELENQKATWGSLAFVPRNVPGLV